MHSVSLYSSSLIAYDQSNHLTSPRRLYLQLRFRNLSDFLAVRNDLLSQVLRNIQEKDDHEIEVELAKATAKLQVSIDNSWSTSPFKGPAADPRESITDIREYDIPYCLQVAIDNGILLLSALFSIHPDGICRCTGRSVV